MNHTIATKYRQLQRLAGWAYAFAQSLLTDPPKIAGTTKNKSHINPQGQGKEE